MKRNLLAALLIGAATLPTLQGCFPAVVAGVSSGVTATIDRRTLGMQTEDEAIEWKASSRVGDKLRDRGHFNFTSYNRQVLLSGEVASDELKAEAERIVAAVPNVRGVFNELVVGASSSLTARSNDAYTTSKVKARFVDAGKFNAIHVKVVTEAGSVFLMGLVTKAEADAAIQVARTTTGVRRVVPLMETITPAKARELDLAQSNNSQPSSTAPGETKAP